MGRKIDNGKSGNGYQAPGVERCFRVMELLGESPEGLTLSELVEKMGASKNGVFRYGAFSLGQSQLDAVIQYIERQKKHHAKKTFKEEFGEFFCKYKVVYDERYVWS